PDTPGRAASASLGSNSPAEVSNASSTLARLIIEAGCTAVVVTLTSASRAAGVKVTGRFFCDGIAVLTGRGEGEGSASHPTSQPDTPELSSDTLLVWCGRGLAPAAQARCGRAGCGT